MQSHDLSLVRFCVINYFAVILSSRPFYPISTLLIKLTKSLITCEPEPDENIKEKVDWIYNNTHKDVLQPLAVIELAVFKNLYRGLNREIEIGDRTFMLVELYKYLDEVAQELTLLVIDIAKKYSIDIPLNSMGMMQSNINKFNFDIEEK